MTSNAQYLNSLFDTVGKRYKEPKMALQEIPGDIKGIAENATTIFSNEHFVGADAILELKLGDLNKPWVCCAEGIADPILKEEMEKAKRYVRWIPEYRIKDFNITEKLISITKKLDAKFTSVDKDTRRLKEGIELPGKYKIIEDWTVDNVAYQTFLAYNEIFRKFVLIKTPRPGQFKRLKDFMVMISLWLKISDHPNIQSIHYIEMLNDTPQIALEYMASATIERNSM